MLHNHFYFARKPRKNSQYLIKTDFPEGNHCLQEKIFKLSPKSDLCFPEISMELKKKKKKFKMTKKFCLSCSISQEPYTISFVVLVVHKCKKTKTGPKSRVFFRGAGGMEGGGAPVFRQA